MKKLLIAILPCLFCIPALAQTVLPYSKFLSFWIEQLSENRFKYNDNKNQWVLGRGFVLDKTEATQFALHNMPKNYRPQEDNYQITIQNGTDGIAFIDVLFYKDNTFHELLTFAKDHGENLIETNSHNLQKYQFNFEGFTIELSVYTQEIKATSDKDKAITQTQDVSYNIYNYTIYTGIEPASPWLTKQRAKQEKQDTKGKKKQNISDYM